MPTSPTTRAALYARVSTHHGQDVVLQLDALREVAAARGWVVVEEFVDKRIPGTRTPSPRNHPPGEKHHDLLDLPTPPPPGLTN